MGSALIKGLIQSGKTSPDMVRAFDVDSGKTDALVRDLGITAVSTLQGTVSKDDTILILAVKPQVIGSVLDALASELHDRVLIISIAAGISTSFLSNRIGQSIRLIRAMPNAAAVIGQSITALSKGGAASDHDLRMAQQIFSAIGHVVTVEESMMNAVTALSSSGLGYLFLIMEALTDAGVRVGLDRKTARDLTVHTLGGAAAMAESSDMSFCALKDIITSPAGTTIAGLQVIEKAGLRGTLMDAVEAATMRASELSAK
jgi:pyrroline-5-carboxylate reductase